MEDAPLQALVTLLLSVAGYLVFAGQVSMTEIMAAVPAACLVTAFATLRHRGQNRPLQLRAPWSPLIRSTLAALLFDTGRVGAQLLRHAVGSRHCSDGTIGRQPFRPGGPDRADAGRRALVTLATSFAPNGFVLDIAPSMMLGNESVLLMHRLVPSAPASDGEWPV